jgi:phage/plasmid-associated DNA primase
MEKLGKCRLGYTTEFKEEDELNETNLKAITGKDFMNVRGIQRTDESLETTSNLAIITNELPSFKVEQAILCDRLIVIPFNAQFPVVDNLKMILLPNET